MIPSYGHSPLHYCAECGDEFAPVEYREVPAGEVEFCSDGCEDSFRDREEVSFVYDMTRYTAAPVF